MTFSDDQTLPDALRAYGLVIVSPHHDDACFSIGAILAAVGEGVLINVFTQSSYLAQRPAGLYSKLSIDDVVAIRTAEDEAFAARCGLVRQALGCREPALHGRRPNDLTGLDQDIAEASRPLLSALAEPSSTPGRRFLLVPLAAGRHVNHLAVHAIVVRALDDLSQRFRIGFYEDLPYAHNPIERRWGLAKLARLPAGRSYRRYTFTPPWAGKRDLIECYPTQLRRAPGRLKFRLAALWPLPPHEAIWIRPDDLRSEAAR